MRKRKRGLKRKKNKKNNKKRNFLTGGEVKSETPAN